MTEIKKTLENIKDQIIKEVFNNQELSLEEKVSFCKELESFGETWRILVLMNKLSDLKEVTKNDLELEKLKLNIK